MPEAATADTAKAVDQVNPKADAGAGGTMLDKVMSSLDSLHGRMDGFEDFMKKSKADSDQELEVKNKEAEGENKKVVDKKRKDSRDDAVAKADRDKDMDTTVGNVTKGDEAKADWDDEDEDKKKDSKPVKADAKPPVKADWDDEEDKDKKKDSKKADAKRKDGFGEDEQEKEIAKGDARADGYIRVKAADWETMNERVARIDSFVNRSDEDRAAFANAQAKADSIYGAFGKRAPANLPGEVLTDYRKRLATPFRQYSATWKEEKLSGIPDSVFNKIEDSIYADAMKAAENPPDLAEGELRQVIKQDPNTGMRHIDFYGESFIKGLSRPSRRVAAFRTRGNAA